MGLTHRLSLKGNTLVLTTSRSSRIHVTKKTVERYRLLGKIRQEAWLKSLVRLVESGASSRESQLFDLDYFAHPPWERFNRAQFALEMFSTLTGEFFVEKNDPRVAAVRDLPSALAFLKAEYVDEARALSFVEWESIYQHLHGGDVDKAVEEWERDPRGNALRDK
jgi:hypothetical protein